MKILLENITFINPDAQPQVANIAIADGVFYKIGKFDDFRSDQTIDGQKLMAIPGMIDLSARLREPGFGHKGTIQSESMAAVAGGISTICMPPDTNPVIDNPAVVELIEQRQLTSARARILPLAAITQGLKGQQLASMGVMRQEGCVGVSNVLRPFASIHVLRQALKYAKTVGMKAHLYALDSSLLGVGVAHEGAISTRFGLPGIPEVAETCALAQILILAEDLKTSIHICRISCARSVELIREAKARGIKVTCDVAIHQLFYTEDDLIKFNSNFYVIPPFRTKQDRAALRQAVLEGTIDAICSDHQPHESDAKNAPFADSEAGISSFDSFLSMILRFCQEEGVALSKVLARVTTNPAQIVGQKQGLIQEGKPADIVLFAPDKEWRLSKKYFFSKGKNTPLFRKKLKGQVKQVIIEGRVVFSR